VIRSGRLDAALSATWPAAETTRCGPFTLRFGAGGKRCRAATLHAAGSESAAICEAAAALSARGQVPLFRVWAGQAAFDARLAAHGYRRVDPTIVLSAPTTALAHATLPPVTAFDIWPPLAIQREIWADAGVDDDQRAVMERVRGPKAALFGRIDNRPAGAGFVAMHDGIAMVHALVVRPASRRRGLARHLVVHAAKWALPHGAGEIAVAVTRKNTPARALYAALGMTGAGGYHYREAAGGAHER